MPVTFTKPIIFKVDKNVGVVGCDIEYWKSKLSSGLELVGQVFVMTTPHIQSKSVFLFENILNKHGQYTTPYGDIYGYNVDSMELVLTQMGFTLVPQVLSKQQFYGIYGWMPTEPSDKEPLTPRVVKPVAKIQKCSCGFTTDYEIECIGDYICRQCQYQKDCFGNK